MQNINTMFVNDIKESIHVQIYIKISAVTDEDSAEENSDGLLDYLGMNLPKSKVWIVFLFNEGLGESYGGIQYGAENQKETIFATAPF